MFINGYGLIGDFSISSQVGYLFFGGVGGGGGGEGDVIGIQASLRLSYLHMQ